MNKRTVSINLRRKLEASDLTNLANSLIELELLLKDSAWKINYVSSDYYETTDFEKSID